MKILFYIGSLEKGGAERVISNLANYFVTDNEIVFITNVNKIEYSLNKDIIFYSLEDKRKINIIQQLQKLNQIIKNEKPDIIISFLTGANFRILLLRKFANVNIPIVISVRNDPKKEYKSLQRKILMRLLYSKTDGIVFQTEDAKKYFSNKIQKKSKVIPNPIKKEFISREKYTGEKENIIVSVGRLEKQKNQSLLIDSFYDISDKFPNYKLIIYGEGSLRKELENKIKKLNMQNKIFLPGIVDNIQEKIEKAKLFIMTSDYEGMPNALMEAMALGLPCISTNCPCGGPKYLIKDKEDGILVKVNDKKELVNSINYLLENPEISKKFGDNASNKISKELNPDKINKEWEKYISLIGENK